MSRPAARTKRWLTKGQHIGAVAQDGFTLLEVLVAFVIVFLASVAIFRGGRESLRSVSVAGRTEEALAIGQARLSGFEGVAIPGGTELRGDETGGFHWTLRATPLGSIALRAGVGSSMGSTVLYRVSVTVSWTGGDHLSSVSLQSQRLTPMPPSLP